MDTVSTSLRLRLESVEKRACVVGECWEVRNRPLLCCRLPATVDKTVARVGNSARRHVYNVLRHSPYPLFVLILRETGNGTKAALHCFQVSSSSFCKCCVSVWRKFIADLYLGYCVLLFKDYSKVGGYISLRGHTMSELLIQQLASTEDWDSWYESIRRKSQDLDVWEYIDPEGIGELEEPKSPTYTLRSSGPWLDNRDAENEYLAFRKKLWRRYNEDRWSYREATLKLQHVNFHILGTVPVEVRDDLSQNAATARERLVRLKKQFEPTPWQRRGYIYAQYRRVNQTPLRKDVQSWTASWLSAATDAIEGGVLTEYIVKKDFYNHIGRIDSKFCRRWEEGIDLEGDDIGKIVESFQELWDCD